MNFWALVPAGLLSAALVGLGAMASIAGRDPGFAIERNYYEKAVHWDHEQAQRAENARLGYELTLSYAAERATVVVRGLEANRTPLIGARLRAEAFANARASELHPLVFREQAPGIYETKLDVRRSGVWEFRLDLQQGGRRFTHTTRVDLARSGQ